MKRKYSTVKTNIFIGAILLLSFHLNAQKIKQIAYPSEIRGAVKKIEIYQYQPQIFDTLKTNSKFESGAYLIEEKFFDESSGLETKRIRHNRRDKHTIETKIFYDKYQNVLSRIKCYSRDNRCDTTTNKYDYRNKTLTTKSTGNTISNFGEKTAQINYTISYLDNRNIVTSFETYGLENELLRYNIRVVDSLDRLSIDSIYEYTTFKRSTKYKYDTLNTAQLSFYDCGDETINMISSS